MLFIIILNLDKDFYKLYFYLNTITNVVYCLYDNVNIIEWVVYVMYILYWSFMAHLFYT